MPKNPYFQFKEFTIWQDRCAMKVSTDACILGALVEAEQGKTAIDIGTGTGLLAFFLAQKNPALLITALEIVASAAQQAQENVEKNKFPNIQIIHQSVQNFVLENDQKYDLIICNPPYFVESTLSNHADKAKARHTISLNFAELAESVAILLDRLGKFWVVLPLPEMRLLEKKMAEKGLFLEKEIEIKNFEDRQAHRLVSVFGKTQKDVEKTELIIFSEAQIYTSEFVRLLKPYYLYL